MSSDLTRHDLYELCVQSPKHLVPFLSAVHGRSPGVLAEDFAGTAALSHLWVESDPDARAIATDLDSDALGYHGAHDRITKHHANVLHATDHADVLFVGNFSIGYWHTRAELVAYLKHARQRLSSPVTDGGGGPRSGSEGVPPGLFICDTYGGESAFLLGDVHRDHWIPPNKDGQDDPDHPLAPHAGKRVRYTWEQRSADPLTGMVTDVLHFRVESGGTIEAELDDAFVYEWRLWSVPELRDAMAEAGFARTEVYAKTGDAIDDEGNVYVLPVEDAEEELDDSFIVLVAART